MDFVITDGISGISSEALGNVNRDEVTSIIFPASAREVGFFAFADLKNLERVVFNDGLRNIGTCAFKGCAKLESIELPASIVNIGAGAFRDCPILDCLSFRDGGMEKISVSPNSFAATAASARLQKQCAAENAHRNALRLQKVYSDVCATDFFKKYCSAYEKAIARYRNIENWESEEALLREVFYERNNPVSRLMLGMISEEAWRLFDRSVAAEICRKLSAAEADTAAVVGECRRLFDAETLRVTHAADQHRALFNRIATSLLRDRQLVQIIDFDKLRTVVDFLRGNGYISSYETPPSPDEWYACSHTVYRSLSAIFPEKSPFEIGVFAWCIAEVSRSESKNPSDEEKEMRRVMVTSLKNHGL